MAVPGKEEDAVRSVVMDYLERWFEGDRYARRLEDRQRGVASPVKVAS
jgi:hypothetical protein